ncbi:hypothetical protein TR51_24510 [Kitasatospora griseola]|uniref:Uncharacterized protein n=1 Tax=Kitasatospora griseola TaxID=2064 RepID=A0A0D0PP78_KITGR|nr:hypothetical protein TR51_24510 [Kitasatospora griseola]
MATAIATTITRSTPAPAAARRTTTPRPEFEGFLGTPMEASAVSAGSCAADDGLAAAPTSGTSAGPVRMSLVSPSYGEYDGLVRRVAERVLQTPFRSGHDEHVVPRCVGDGLVIFGSDFGRS